jgi:hypothetical protein
MSNNWSETLLLIISLADILIPISPFSDLRNCYSLCLQGTGRQEFLQNTKIGTVLKTEAENLILYGKEFSGLYMSGVAIVLKCRR